MKYTIVNVGDYPMQMHSEGCRDIAKLRRQVVPKERTIDFTREGSIVEAWTPKPLYI